MTRKEAKDILLKFVEENKYKSDWNGFLAGAILTYLEPIDEERLDKLANYYMLNPDTVYAYDIKLQMEAYKAGYRKAMEE